MKDILIGDESIKVEVKTMAAPCTCGRIVEVEFRELILPFGFRTGAALPLTEGDKLLHLVKAGFSIKCTDQLQGVDEATKTIYRNTDCCMDSFDDLINGIYHDFKKGEK